MYNLIFATVLFLSGVARAAIYDSYINQELQKTTLAYKRLAEKTLKADPQLKQEFDAYHKKVTSLMNQENVPRHTRIKGIQLVTKQFEPKFKELIKNAGIVQKDLNNEVAKIFFTASKKFSRKFKWTITDSLAIQWRALPELETSGPVINPVTISHEPPFDSAIISKLGVPSRVNLVNGTFMTLSTSTGIELNIQESGISHFFEMQPGLERTRVVAEIASSEYFLMLLSMVGAAASSNSVKLAIRSVTRVICDTDFDLGSLFSFLPMWVDISGTEQFTLSCEVAAEDNLRDLSLSVKSISSSSSTMAAGASAYNNVTMRRLKLEHHNP